MAFVPWKDRVTATPHRYTLTNVSGDTYDLTAVHGEISEAGTPVNAANLNKLIQRDGDDIKDTVTTFTEGIRENIATGEKTSTIFGKIKKWFTDLKAHAFNDLATALGAETDKAPTNKLLNDTAALKVDKTSISTVIPISSAAASNDKVLGEKVVYDEFAKTADNLNAIGKEINSKVIKELSIKINAKKPLDGNWSAKTWTGLASFDGSRIWTDGTNIYYSSGTTQYVLDVATSTWSAKTWTGLTRLYGNWIWTDGTDIYYSDAANQYVLDVATSTWSAKTWTGLASFDGNNIWTDGTNIYYTSGPSSYILISRKSIRNWGNPSTIDDLRGINVSVPTSAWAADATYAAYPYRAAVTVTGLTANHTGIINFNDTALALGTLKDGAKTYAGGFYIYASAVPSVTVTIESYVFWEV